MKPDRPGRAHAAVVGVTPGARDVRIRRGCDITDQVAELVACDVGVEMVLDGG